MPPDESVIHGRLRALLARELRLSDVPADAELLVSGMMDSLGLVELLAALEIEFDIVVPVEGLEIDDFRTLNAIAAFVQARLRYRPAEADAAAAPRR